MVIALSVIWLVAAFVLLGRGMRARVMDDHPVCAGCGYDLVGVKARMPERCPECGAGLGGNGRVKLGNRRRRAGLLWAGAAMAGAWVLVWGPIMATSLAKPADQPTWLLMVQAKWKDGPAAAPVVGELLNRLANRSLSKEDQRALVERAMAVSTRPSEPGKEPAGWDPCWKDVLEEPSLLGLLPGERQAEVWRLGISATLEARKRILVDGPGLPVGLRIRFDRRLVHPSERRFACDRVSVSIKGVGADGTVVATGESELKYSCLPVTISQGTGWQGQDVAIALTGGQPLAPGIYMLEVSAPSVVEEWAGFGALPRPPAATPAFPRITIPTMSLRQPIAILAADDAAQGVIEAPELRAAMQEHVHVMLFGSAYSPVQTWLGVGLSMDDQSLKSVGAELERRGITCHYKVVIDRKNVDAAATGPAKGDGLSDPTEIGHATMCFRQGGWVLSPGGKQVDQEVTAGRYRVRFIPDWAGAQQTIEHERILGGELVFEGVELFVKK